MPAPHRRGSDASRRYWNRAVAFFHEPGSLQDLRSVGLGQGMDPSVTEEDLRAWVFAPGHRNLVYAWTHTYNQVITRFRREHR